MISESLKSSTHSVSAYDNKEAENAQVIQRVSPPLRTLEDVRAQVAHEVAVRAITKSQILDGNPTRYF